MPDVLIFDDDPALGDLAGELLRGKGLTVGHFKSGAGVLELIREGRPRLVVLDIMMPGMDGLSACRAVRASPSTKHVKIIVLTAKSSAQDKETARRCGADDFLVKPFDPGAFARSVSKVLDLPVDPEPPAAGPKPPAPPVAVTLLPVGAVVETAALWVMFEGGRGLRDYMGSRPAPPSAAWMLLSRGHPDCVEEIDAGGLLLSAGVKVSLGGPDDPDNPLQLLAPKMLQGRGARATPLLYPQREGEFQLAPGISAMAQYTHHPGLTMAYRVDIHGRRVVWCPAHAIDRERVEWDSFEMDKFRAFFSSADLLLHGYRRSQSDPAPDDGLGSGAWEPVVDLAAESRVRQLVLFPLPRTPEIPGLEAQAQERVRAEGLSSLRCNAAQPMQHFIL